MKQTFLVKEVPGAKRSSERPYTHAVIGIRNYERDIKEAGKIYAVDKENYKYYCGISRLKAGDNYAYFAGNNYPVSQDEIDRANKEIAGMANADSYAAAKSEARVRQFEEIKTKNNGGKFEVLRWSQKFSNAAKAITEFQDRYIKVSVVETQIQETKPKKKTTLAPVELPGEFPTENTSAAIKAMYEAINYELPAVTFPAVSTDLIPKLKRLYENGKVVNVGRVWKNFLSNEVEPSPVHAETLYKLIEKLKVRGYCGAEIIVEAKTGEKCHVPMSLWDLEFEPTIHTNLGYIGEGKAAKLQELFEEYSPVPNANGYFLVFNEYSQLKVNIGVTVDSNSFESVEHFEQVLRTKLLHKL